MLTAFAKWLRGLFRPVGTMTLEEARAEAQRRWPPNGGIEYGPSCEVCCLVGLLREVSQHDREERLLVVLGRGSTWEEAFAESDRGFH